MSGGERAFAALVGVFVAALFGVMCAGVCYEAQHPCEEFGPEHLVNSTCPVYGGKQILWTPCVKVERDCLRRAP